MLDWKIWDFSLLEGALIVQCEDRGREHKFFIINELTGAIEGIDKVKLFAVLACTACGHSILHEHIIDKEDAAKLTQKGK